MLQLPEVIKATDQITRERAAGQVSLFGAGNSLPPSCVLGSKRNGCLLVCRWYAPLTSTRTWSIA